MSNKERINETVNKLVNATDAEEVKLAYKHWANDYNFDLHTFGYVAPQIGVNLFVQKLITQKNADKQSLIHDAGCGTGLVGELLGQLGYTNIHGSDFSEEMLEKAKDTSRYSQLMSLDFAAALPLPDNGYDAAISIGVYTKRFKQHLISEMIRIIRPSGYFVFSCREQYYEEVVVLIAQLLKDKSISNASIQHDEYMSEQNASAFYFALQKSETVLYET